MRGASDPATIKLEPMPNGSAKLNTLDIKPNLEEGNLSANKESAEGVKADSPTPMNALGMAMEQSRGLLPTRQSVRSKV